jgi:cbb3-type cytochrome oxidase maturation protein
MAGMFGDNPLQMLIPIAIFLGAVIIFAFWTAGF